MTPMPLPHGRVFLTGGYKAGSALLQVRREDDGFTVKELWKKLSLRSTIAQGLLWKDHIYGNSVTAARA